MKTINLKFFLMILIILIAIGCLFSTAALVLYQADSKSKQGIAVSAESIDKQLELQLFRISQRFDIPERFPDFDLWTESEQSSGLCVRFERLNATTVKSACRGALLSEQWPRWFEKIYRWSFQPGQEVVRQVAHNGEAHGFVTVSPSVEMELTRAWRDVKKLMGLSAMTIVSLCFLLYFAVDWALRPARLIVTGLEQMAQGRLSSRLPSFNITEWLRTAQAINHLAENLEKTLSDRKQLAFKLVNAQEEERCFLARELHDEFGQSLAGLAAVASSITQTAKIECPNLVPEGQSIGRITTHMMELLRDMLMRLRPTDFDELGLTQSLQAMVTEWNVRSGGETIFELDIIGDFDHLPNPIAVNIFRIVQECLTNVSKHSAATNANVKLERSFSTKIGGTENSEESIALVIEDDGIAEDIAFSDSPGVGLLGMRERVAALGGQLTLQAIKTGGLKIHIWIPLQITRES